MGQVGAARRPWKIRIRGQALDIRVIRRLLDYLRPHTRSVVWALLLVSVTSAMQLIGPYLLKVAIDNYLVERQDAFRLSMVAIGFALTLLVAWASKAGESYTMAAVTQRVLTQCQSRGCPCNSMQ